ncbi:uncharacterized protein AKAME5_001697400 [Lates japonicus]|uniref:Uncharacterized protein n=1 Tax=Lates japonicus TaxID=270547 RepID=A0AAD3N4S9_LATJO|nr:uncharacterized protein AKAME5_001697400 [Lates japonicus]
MSFDDLVKKRIEQSKHTTDVDLPPAIRWTGIGRHLSDLSISSPRHLDVGSLTPQQAEDSRERKGLSALKAMSTERRKWDTEDEDLGKGKSPLFDAHSTQGDPCSNYRRFVEDIKPLAKQPLTQLHPSSSLVNERRAGDLLYGIPRYRKHNIGDIEPPQEAPPPIPATLPPDEAVELTWRCPPGSRT